MRPFLNLFVISFLSLATGACQKMDKVTNSETDSIPTPAQASQPSGIKGHVSLEQIAKVPGASSKISSYKTSIAFTKVVGGEMSVTQSDKNGNFEVNLLPGDYVVTPADPTPLTGPSPSRENHTVHVGNGYASITIRYMSGF